MKHLVFLFVLIGLSGCSRPMNKAIIQPLEADEIRQLQKKDTVFAGFYEAVQKMQGSFLSDQVNQAKYGKITYGQLRDYCVYRNDTAAFGIVIDRARTDWQTISSGYDGQLDSIAAYWNEYMKDNSLDSYLKLELQKIEKEYDPHTNDVKNVLIGIEMTPLKGTIQGVRFSIEFKNKAQSDDFDLFEFLFDRKRDVCEVAEPFSHATLLYGETGEALKNLLAGMTLAQVRKHYNVVFDIEEVKIGNKKFSNDELLIPKSVKGYLEYPTLYRDDVIKELIDTEYLSEKDYIKDAVQTVLKMKDEQCYDLLQAYRTPFMED